MAERHFRVRVTCRYREPNNAVEHLKVDLLTKSGWQPLDLNIDSPGFQIFVYAIMACQHLYVRANCAERGLMIESAQGGIQVTAAEDWKIQRLHVSFDVHLRSGEPTADDIGYIIDRMGKCPSTINLRDIPDRKSEVRFV
jgi:hypothetical protein